MSKEELAKLEEWLEDNFTMGILPSDIYYSIIDLIENNKK